jgi:hypothetical protein
VIQRLRQILRLFLHRVRHGQALVDILLAPVDDSDEAELERVDATGEDVGSVRAGVHKVELGEDADRSEASRVDRAGKFEGVGVGKVDVGGGDGEDDAGEEKGQVQLAGERPPRRSDEVGVET